MAEKAVVDTTLAGHFAALTNPGARPSNQDAMQYAQQDNIACFVVSDGVGGEAGGEVASAIVVESIVDSFLEESSFGTRAVQSYVDSAIAGVARRKSESGGLMNMSATVATVLIDLENRTAVWAHMGDTRIYMFRSGKILHATKDHSLVQQIVSAGLCAPDLLRTHPQRSTLLAAIGAEGDCVTEVTPAAIAVESGDAFLICTDGFWEWITELEMEREVFAAASEDDWLRAMSSIVESRGKASTTPADNFTAYAICVRESA